MLASLDQGIDLTATTAPGGMIKGENLAIWRQQRIQMKFGSSEESAVYLGWTMPAQFTIRLPSAGFPSSAGDALIFNLADAGKAPGWPSGTPPEPSDLASRST